MKFSVLLFLLVFISACVSEPGNNKAKNALSFDASEKMIKLSLENSSEELSGVIQFGDIPLGETRTKRLTITNTQKEQSLNLKSLSFTNSSYFTIQSNFSARSLAPEQSTQITLTITPQAESESFSSTRASLFYEGSRNDYAYFDLAARPYTIGEPNVSYALNIDGQDYSFRAGQVFQFPAMMMGQVYNHQVKLKLINTGERKSQVQNLAVNRNYLSLSGQSLNNIEIPSGGQKEWIVSFNSQATGLSAGTDQFAFVLNHDGQNISLSGGIEIQQIQAPLLGFEGPMGTLDPLVPATIDMGMLIQNSDVLIKKSFELRNLGSQNLIIQNLKLHELGIFSITDIEGSHSLNTSGVQAQIAPGQSLTFNVAMNALGETGSHSGVLSFRSNGIGSNNQQRDIIINLQGVLEDRPYGILQIAKNGVNGMILPNWQTGQAPSYTFPIKKVGEVAPQVVFYLKNIGNSELTISQASLDSLQTNFDIALSPPFTLGANTYTTLSVVAKTQKEHVSEPLLTVVNNGLEPQYRLKLRAEVQKKVYPRLFTTADNVTIPSGQAIDFGRLNRSQNAITKRVVVTNIGPTGSQLTIQNISTSGTSFSRGNICPGLGSALPSGQGLCFDISLNSQVLGENLSGNLELQTAELGTVTIPLKAAVYENNNPRLSVVASTAFSAGTAMENGDVFTVGSTSIAEEAVTGKMTLTNSGGGDLVISSVDLVAGAGENHQFQLINLPENTFPLTLNAGGSKILDFSLESSEIGSFNTQVTINSNQSTFSFTLKGNVNETLLFAGDPNNPSPITETTQGDQIVDARIKLDREYLPSSQNNNPNLSGAKLVIVWSDACWVNLERSTNDSQYYFSQYRGAIPEVSSEGSLIDQSVEAWTVPEGIRFSDLSIFLNGGESQGQVYLNDSCIVGISQNTDYQLAGSYNGANLSGVDHLQKINFDDVAVYFENETNDKKVEVAIIDTGFDLQNNRYMGDVTPLGARFDLFSDDNNPQDEMGHGTEVGSLLFANPKESDGSNAYTAGIAHNTSVLLPYRVTDKWSDETLWSQTVNGETTSYYKFNSLSVFRSIKHAVNEGAEVINLSLTAPGRVCDATIGHAIYKAIEKGVVVVISAGAGTSFEVEEVSDNETIARLVPGEVYGPRFFSTWNYQATSSPACWGRYFKGAVTVAALNQNLTDIASVSNWGRDIEIAAPGEGLKTYGLNNQRKTVSGTSYSASLVSGAISQLIAIHKEKGWRYNPWYLEEMLLQGSKTNTSLTQKIYRGKSLDMLELKNHVETLKQMDGLARFSIESDNPEEDEWVDSGFDSDNTDNATLVDLIMTGPPLISNYMFGQLNVLALFNNGASKVVSSSSQWEIISENGQAILNGEAQYADITDTGLLIPHPSAQGDYVVRASYSHLGITKHEEYSVRVVKLNPTTGSNSPLSHLEILSRNDYTSAFSNRMNTLINLPYCKQLNFKVLAHYQNGLVREIPWGYYNFQVDVTNQSGDMSPTNEIWNRCSSIPDASKTYSARFSYADAVGQNANAVQRYKITPRSGQLVRTSPQPGERVLQGGNIQTGWYVQWADGGVNTFFANFEYSLKISNQAGFLPDSTLVSDLEVGNYNMHISVDFYGSGELQVLTDHVPFEVVDAQLVDAFLTANSCLGGGLLSTYEAHLNQTLEQPMYSLWGGHSDFNFCQVFQSSDSSDFDIRPGANIDLSGFVIESEEVSPNNWICYNTSTNDVDLYLYNYPGTKQFWEKNLSISITDQVSGQQVTTHIEQKGFSGLPDSISLEPNRPEILEAYPSVGDDPRCLVEAVFERENFHYHAGNGSESEPYLICNSEQLSNINHVKAFDMSDGSQRQGLQFTYFELGKNIDMAVDPLDSPISGARTSLSSEAFVLNGKDRRISNLTLVDSERNQVGIFSEISNMFIENLIIDNSFVRGHREVGLIAGEAKKTYLKNVTVLNGTTWGVSNVGGLIGKGNNVLFEDCRSVESRVLAEGSTVGGFIGELQSGMIYRSFSTGDVLGTGLPGNNVNFGGLVGYFNGAGWKTLYGESIDNPFRVKNYSELIAEGKNANLNWSGIVDSFNRGNVLTTYNAPTSGSFVNPCIRFKGTFADAEAIIYSVGCNPNNEGFALDVVDNSSLSNAGGLIGSSTVSILNSYASGHVIGLGKNVGGLVGFARDKPDSRDFSTSGFIYRSYHTGGMVVGSSNVGGIAGVYSNIIQRSNSSSLAILSKGFTGGLIGEAGMLVVALNSSANVDTIRSLSERVSDGVAGGIIGHLPLFDEACYANRNLNVFESVHFRQNGNNLSDYGSYEGQANYDHPQIQAQ